MLRKGLTLGIGFILAVTLLSVSMVLCFTYDAEADGEWDCFLKANPECERWFYGDHPSDKWACTFIDHGHPHTMR